MEQNINSKLTTPKRVKKIDENSKSWQSPYHSEAFKERLSQRPIYKPFERGAPSINFQ